MMDDKKTIVEEGEEMPPPPAPVPTSQEKAEIEKLEEQKLKSKFPSKSILLSLFACYTSLVYL